MKSDISKHYVYLGTKITAFVSLSLVFGSVIWPNLSYRPTLESRIIGGVGIIGGLDIVMIINNSEGWNNRGVGRG